MQFFPDLIKEKNIAEYILFMYQTEDVIRSFQLDIEKIQSHYIDQVAKNNQEFEAYTKWFLELIKAMKVQRIEEKGHLFEIQEVLIELSYLHNSLLNLTQDSDYVKNYNLALEHIDNFKQKSNLKDKNHIEIMFHALYMKLLLKLKKKEISSETNASFEIMTSCISSLAKRYHQMKKGDMNFLNN